MLSASPKGEGTRNDEAALRVVPVVLESLRRAPARSKQSRCSYRTDQLPRTHTSRAADAAQTQQCSVREGTAHSHLSKNSASAATPNADRPLQHAIYRMTITASVHNEFSPPLVAKAPCWLAFPLGSEAPRDNHAVSPKLSSGASET